MMDCGDTVIVKTRTPHICQGCLTMIPAGTRVYHCHGKSGGEWQNWYIHQSGYAALNLDLDQQDDTFSSGFMNEEGLECK